MTIKEAQNLVNQWIKEYGVRYFSELTNLAVLTEEVGELARVMARRYGDQSWKATDPRSEDNGQQALGEEMADILWVLLCLANQTGIDLTEELKKSIEKKTRRDSLRHIGCPMRSLRCLHRADHHQMIQNGVGNQLGWPTPFYFERREYHYV